MQQQQLDINQDMINFNKKMWLANTIIQGTQAAVALTKAAVGLGQAIQGLHDQKTDMDVRAGTREYKFRMLEAITNGYLPYKEEEIVRYDGNGRTVEKDSRYIGFDNYEYKLADGTTRTLGQLKQDIIGSVGNNYWTNSGSERGMQIAASAFEDIELEGQMRILPVIQAQRAEVVNQELINFKNDRDLEGGIKYINGIDWMTADQKTARRLEFERGVKYETFNDEIMSTGRTEGMAAVDRRIEESGDTYSELEKARFRANAQQSSNNASTAARTAANEAYTQMRNNGATIGDAARAASAYAGNNPDAAEAQKREAQRLQRDSLVQEFEETRARFDSMSLDELKRFKSTLGNRRGDYQNQAELFTVHDDLVDAEIARREALMARISRESGPSAAEQADANMFAMGEARNEWAAGKMDRVAVHSLINSQYHTTAEERNFADKLMGMILEGADGDQRTIAAYERFKGYADEKKLPDNLRSEILEHIVQMRQNDYTPENIGAYVDRMLDDEVFRQLTDFNKNPNSAALSNTEFDRFHRSVHEGSADFLNYSRWDRYGDAYAHSIPGADALQEQYRLKAEERAGEILGTNDWKIKFSELEGEGTDRSGHALITIENSAGTQKTVRVAADGRSLEEKTDKGWEDFGVSEGRTAIVRQVNASLPPVARSNINNYIDSAVEAMQASQNNTALERLRRQIANEIGNKFSTYEGQAYIDARIDEALSRVTWR